MTAPLARLRPYFRRCAGRLVLGSLAGIVMNTAAVLPPLLLGRAVDQALAFTAGRADGAAVAWAALAFAGGTLATEGPRVLKRWFLITANARIRASLRADAVRGVLGWPLARLHEATVGDLMSRIISDVEVVGIGVRELTVETWDTLLLCLSLVVTLLIMSPALSLVALAPVPFAMALALASGRWVAQRTRGAREANGRLAEGIHGSILATRLVRLLGHGAATLARLERLSRGVAQANVGATRLRAGLQPVYSLLMTAGVVLVVWRGAENVVAGAMSTGALVAYLEIFLRFVARGPRIPQLVNSLQSGAAAFERLRGLLPDAAAAAPPPGPAQEPVAGGPTRVSLAAVTFRYPGASRAALRDISLDIPAGSIVVVTGPVGSGKSALARALVGLLPIEGGTIRREPALASVGYLAQDPHLFSGTFADNVALGADAGRVDAAIAIAGLEPDVRSFANGIDTEIGELGVRVSGGQGQRIALARALAAPPDGPPGLLVLDDPFSAVDVDTEAKIIDALRSAFGATAPPERRATIVLCTHRLAACPHADRVILLDGGRVAEAGTHRELLVADGGYAHIYRAQRFLAP